MEDASITLNIISIRWVNKDKRITAIRECSLISPYAVKRVNRQ